MLDMIGLIAAAVMTCTANTAVCPPGSEQPVQAAATVEAAPAVETVETPAQTVITETPIVEAPRQKTVVTTQRKAPKVKLVSAAKPVLRSKLAFKRKIEIPVIIGGYF
jgi:hypothetical protein